MTEPAFRLVQRDRRPDPLTLRTLLMARPTPHRVTSHEQSASDYVLDDDLETAVNMAIAVGDPLIVTGGPGTGKTQLAYFLGGYFEIPVRAYHVKSTSTARDLKWEFDAVGYLQAAYAASREAGPAKSRNEFLERGPLWLAYEDPNPCVLLIDEIDKAPRDFPNDLLHELDQGWFHHPFDRDLSGHQARVPAEAQARPPIVIITSNVERQLPGPFLRRCIFHHIELTEALVNAAVSARVNSGALPNLEAAVRTAAIRRFWELRDAMYALQRPPATGELLVWLLLLNARGVSVDALEAPLHKLPCLGALIKDHDDLLRLTR